MKKKLLGGMLLGACIALGCAPTAMADSRKVVTLGADLSQDQKDTMMRYFGVSYDGVEIIYINNQQERDYLGAYVPLEQIGSHTYSCALVAPTSSGGIQVKTANLEWVTCNMIASTLSTSGVTNCQVVAACPFKVSGTGALTGVIMAYENASRQTLDPVKVELANQELVATGNLSNEVGQSKATAIINETKSQVIENNITSIEEITNIINDVSTSYDVVINEDQSAEIAELMEQIAQQEYDITQLKATLDRVQANVAGDAGASEEEQKAAEAKAEASEQAALEALKQEQAELEAAMQAQQQEISENGEFQDSNGVIIIDDAGVTEDWEEEDNILDNTDPSALEGMGGTVEEADTTQTVQEQSEEQAQEQQTDVWDGWDTEDGTFGDNVEVYTGETETENSGVEVYDPAGEQLPLEGEQLPLEGEQLPLEGEQLPLEGVEQLPAEGETEMQVPDETDLIMPEETEAEMEELSEEILTGEDREVFDDIKADMDLTFVGGMITSEDGSAQVYLSEDAETKVPERVLQYILKVMTQGADVVAEMEKADPSIPQDIIEKTKEQAPDKEYEDEQLAQIDKFVRRMVFQDSEKLLEDSYLEEADEIVLYDQIMAILEEAYGVEDDFVEEIPDTEMIDETLPEETAEDAPVEGAGEIMDEFADFEEETGEF